MDQAGREVKESVRALALRAAAKKLSPPEAGDPAAAFPDEHETVFDTTVRVFGKMVKRRGEVAIEAVTRVVHESVEEPVAVGLRLVGGRD